MEAIIGSLLMFGVVWFATRPLKRPRGLTPQEAAFRSQIIINEWHRQGYRPYDLNRGL
jgi:hypothetical protein